MRKKPLLGLLLLVAMTPCRAEQTVATPLPAEQAEKIDEDVERALQRFGSPGAVILVLQNDQIAYFRAFGSRTLVPQQPVLPDTHFEIGSITKQFTAASIMQLQEAGKLQIDDLLADYLPDAPHANEVTLRQLLTHRSGLHDYFDVPAEEFDRLITQPISYSDLIGRIAALPLDFEPGSRWSYSNTGYLLLGKVIEVVSGEPYRTYLEHHIFEPLAMTETKTTAEEHSLANMATGYRHANGSIEQAPIIDASWGGAAGFLVTTAGDLAKWDAALSGGEIVTPESYAEMTAVGRDTDYGLGLVVDTRFGQPRIGHTGGSIGFTTADEYFPRQRTRVIAFTNLGDEAPEAAEALTNIVFADLYPSIAASAARPAPGEDSHVTSIVRSAVGELQTGGRYASFDDRLKAKLLGDLGKHFTSALSPYGPATAAVFRGARSTDGQIWFDYQIYFAPGVVLPFSVRTNESGEVAGFSVG